MDRATTEPGIGRFAPNAQWRIPGEKKRDGSPSRFFHRPIAPARSCTDALLLTYGLVAIPRRSTDTGVPTLTVSAPINVPGVGDMKTTRTLQDAPGCTTRPTEQALGAGSGTAAKGPATAGPPGVAEKNTPVSVCAEEPVFVNVTSCIGEVTPRKIGPNESLVGAAVNVVTIGVHEVAPASLVMPAGQGVSAVAPELST